MFDFGCSSGCVQCTLGPQEVTRSAFQVAREDAEVLRKTRMSPLRAEPGVQVTLDSLGWRLCSSEVTT